MIYFKYYGNRKNKKDDFMKFYTLPMSYSNPPSEMQC